MIREHIDGGAAYYLTQEEKDLLLLALGNSHEAWTRLKVAAADSGWTEMSDTFARQLAIATRLIDRLT